MITSWNINNMVGTQDWSEMDEAAKENERKKFRDDIMSYIISRLNNKNDVFFIHELPKSEVQWLSDTIAEKLPDFTLAVPESPGKINTVAVYAPQVYNFGVNHYICCRGTYGKKKFGNGAYINRIICLRNKKDKHLLVGVHVKSEDTFTFYQLLSNVHSDLHENTSVIYMGDFNACAPYKPAKSLLYGFMSLGLADIWLESGGRSTTQTHKDGMRLDYALTDSGSIQTMLRKYKMYIDNTVPMLSDHCPIILSEKALDGLIMAGED
ncbi:MAG: endonuclease/exonuclease/phosphatase family protein [Ruminococcus sp.]|nr:endonuclease/exonuclease/phosphatase family protein [Ruminococcus sp.]